MTSLKKKGIAAAKWSTLATVVSIVVQLLQLITVSHLLTPTDYGLMGMVMVIVAAAVNLTDMGISNAIIHRQDVTRNHLSSLYILNLATSFVISLAIYLSAPLVAAFYEEPQLANPVRWMSLLCLIPAFGQQFEVLSRKELKFGAISKIQIAAYTAGFAIAFAGAYFGYGVYALVGSYLGNAFVRSAGLMIMGWRQWTPTLHFSRADLKGYLSFGVYQMTSNLLQSFISNLDYLILGRMYGAQTLGYYTFAYQLCIMPIQKLTPLINSVTLPVFAKIQDDLAQLRKGYIKIAEGVSYLNAPIYLGLLVTAPLLVTFAFSEKWLPSVPLIQILCVMFLLRSLVVTVQPLLQSKGRMDMYFRYTLLCMAVQVPGLFIGAYLGGMRGLCIAFVAVQVVIFVIQYTYAVRRVLGPSLAPLLRGIAPGLLCGLVMVVGVLAFDWLGRALFALNTGFVLQVICGALLYFAVIFYFNRNLIHAVRDKVYRRHKSVKPG